MRQVRVDIGTIMARERTMLSSADIARSLDRNSMGIV
jgi:hypothetical protein